MTGKKGYTEENAKTIDQWVDDGWIWGMPISHEVYERAVKGDWDMVLTPTKPVPKSWFPQLSGSRILGLASGGGQQMPIFAACGGICTVLDYSDRQLASEEMVARREGYEIEIVKADMTKKFPFADETFDLIFHPVANCYVEEVLPIWKECHRVLKKGGVLLAGVDNGINYIFDDGNPPCAWTTIQSVKRPGAISGSDTVWGWNSVFPYDRRAGGRAFAGGIQTDSPI